MYRAPDQATRGGAPQPADENADVRRIALDGHAYTWPEYVEVYGEDAQRCWDDAYERGVATEVFGDSDASQLAVNAHGEAQPAAAIGDGGPREADAEPRPAAAIDEETPHEEPIQHEQNDSDASQFAGTTSIEEFDLVSSIARYYEAAMEYEVDVWDHD